MPKSRVVMSGGIKINTEKSQMLVMSGGIKINTEKSQMLSEFIEREILLKSLGVGHYPRLQGQQSASEGEPAS